MFILNYICIHLENTWLCYNLVNDFFTFKVDEISEGDVNEHWHFISDIRIKVGIWKDIIVCISRELTEANFIEVVLDVEVRNSCPGKGQALNGSVDVNLLGYIRGWYLVLYIKGDIVQYLLLVESHHLGGDSGI